MKEYRLYIVALQRWLPLWLLMSFVVAGATYAVLSRRGPTYAVHFSYLVSLAEREQSAGYTFDGFYALQATDLFATTLAKWIEAPELIVEAYKEAGVPLPSEDARRLGRSIAANKSAPQLVEVTVAHREAAAAERLAAALQAVTERNVERYHQQGNPAVPFAVVATAPWTSREEPQIPVIVGSVFAVTLLLLINLQLLWEAVGYARRD
jgi:hypothetical protein